MNWLCNETFVATERYADSHLVNKFVLIQSKKQNVSG